MVSSSEAFKDVDSAIKATAEVVRFRFFTISGADANYDDTGTLTKSGTDIFVSGAVQPIDQFRGSHDAELVQQGLLLNDDIRMYVNGSVDTSGTFRVGLGGSPTPIDEYGLATEKGGVNAWKIGGDIVYKKIYLRRLTTGSLTNE